MKRLLTLALVCLAVSGCVPSPSPSPPVVPPASVSYAIALTFGQYGDTVRAQAVAVSKCESGWVATAGAGSYYQGLFQLGRHIVAINVYGGDFLDPYQNAAAARDKWLSNGKSWQGWPYCGRNYP